MSGLTVFVAGALANKPSNGGEAWVRLSWIRGLQRLGCDVWFIEQIEEKACTDWRGESSTFNNSENLAWFREVASEFNLRDRSWLICDNGEIEGPLMQSAVAAASGAVLVNISGHLRDTALKALFRTRVYVDIDPGFTQIWHAQGNEGARLAGHDHYFTVGANVGDDDCPIPTNRFKWEHVVPPVVLADWPVGGGTSGDVSAGAFTTVATWRGPFGPLELDRRRFGLKVHEFRKFITLPEIAAGRFEAALNIHPSETDDLRLLAHHGWRLVDPIQVAGTPGAFRDYVTSSFAEFSAAQGVYVDTHSGWFSDRTTRYLSAGRPALVQDTGFSRHLPVGKGLLTFTTLEEAAAGAKTIISDYDFHVSAARDIATTYFDSDVVLGRFLEQCGCR